MENKKNNNEVEVANLKLVENDSLALRDSALTGTREQSSGLGHIKDSSIDFNL